MPSVTINVSIKNGAASAPRAEARLGGDITWMIEGDLQDGDEVTIGGFRHGDGAPGSPMTKGDNGRKRAGAGPVSDSVRNDATPGLYSYDIALVRSGVASAVDPEIQIKP